MMKKKVKNCSLWLFVLTFVLTGIAGCGTKQKDDQEAKIHGNSRCDQRCG
ncbi:MAG: hypothetical protein ACLVCH_02885 [Roseburia inulinivorans]